MILAHRVCFRQGYALLFGLLDVTCHFGVAHAAVLHDGLLAHFFNNNAVGDVLTDGGRWVFDVGVVRDNGFDFAIGCLDITAFACLKQTLCANIIPNTSSLKPTTTMPPSAQKAPSQNLLTSPQRRRFRRFGTPILARQQRRQRRRFGLVCRRHDGCPV